MPSYLMHLSKACSHALRHAPDEYGIVLDDEGWVPVEELMTALRAHSRDFRRPVGEDLARMMAASEKQRFEMRDGRIRALYGHSLPEKIAKEPAEPPEVLYHGTPPRSAEVILREGLQSMRRQYVHLSTDVPTARLVGGRRSQTPVILTVLAGEAHRAGVRFYQGNDSTWLADSVPPEFIRR